MRSSAAAFMSCATCGHAYLTNGKANDRQLAALTQHSSRQRKRRKGMQGEGHTEHPALVDVGCKGEQAAQSQQPGQSHASTWESERSRRDCGED